MASVTKKYTKVKSFADTKGQMYEVKMSALLFLRGLNSGLPFQLATNVEGAGAFDDIVFKYQPLNTNGPRCWHTVFVQLKHKSNSKIQMQGILAPRGDFSIKKYFDSFLNIKDSMCKHDREELFRGSLDDSRFIIYTNAVLSNELSKCKDHNCQDDLDILTSKNTTEHVMNFSEGCDSNIETKVDIEDKDQKQHFLKNFKIFSGQPTVDEIDDYVEEELLKRKVKRSETKAVASIFFEEFEYWCGTLDDILDENSDILEIATSKRRVEVLEPWQRKDFNLELIFKEHVKMCIKDEIYRSHTLLKIVPNNISTNVSAIKLLSVLECSKIPFLLSTLKCFLSETDAFLSVWKNANKPILVIVCNTEQQSSYNQADIEKALKGIRRVQEENIKKRVVCVAPVDDEFTLRLKREVSGGVKEVQDSFELHHLTQESLEKILDKNVSFQGQGVKMRCIIHHDLEALDNQLINFIVDQGANIVIGQELDYPVRFYIDRTLLRNNYIHMKIFTKPNTPCKFAVSGISDQELKQMIRSRQTDSFDDKQSSVDFGSCDDVKNEEYQFIVLQSDEPKKHFHQLCESHPSMHWLHMVEGRPTWKETRGNITDILPYIVEDESTVHRPSSALDLEDRVVLLVAEPGMGKTTLITHLAQQAKKNDPSDWVVVIRLGNYSHLLDERTNNHFQAEEFLTNVACKNELLSGERVMFQCNLRLQGKIIVILDGVDELPEVCLNNCKALLTFLVETNTKKIWITSRHVRKDQLENHLATVAYTLKKFTESDQLNCIAKLWSDVNTPLKQKEREDFIIKLLKLSHESMADKERQFTGIPLQTIMLAEIFQEKYAHPEAQVLPTKFNLLDLYERFVDTKFNIVIKKEIGIEVLLEKSESRVFKAFKKKLHKKHTFVAFKTLLQPELLNKLQLDNVDSICSKFIIRLLNGIENTGIVDRLINGKPHFVHKTFCEYFVGIWIAREYESSRGFIESHLYHDDFQVVRCIFDRKLALHSALHTAVLDGDVSKFQSLLAVGADVNARDGGGRTPLHIAASVGFTGSSVNEANVIILNMLLERGADVTLRDNVLQWTPLRYANKTRSYGAVNLLLQQCSECFSDMNILMKHKADPVMLTHIAQLGLVHLLHFLLDNGLDINVVVDVFKSTLIHKTAEFGQCATLNLLLEKGSNFTALDVTNSSPLHRASICGQSSVVQALLQYISSTKHDIMKYIKARESNGSTATSLAALNGHTTIVQQLVLAGGDLRCLDKSGRTCLHMASVMGHESLVQWILENISGDSDKVIQFVNARDKERRTALYFAAVNGHVNTVKLLLRAGGNVGFIDKHCMTILHAASQNGHKFVVQCILENIDSDKNKIQLVNSRNSDGRTAISFAAYFGHTSIVQLLVKAGGDILSTDKQGISCLHAVATSGHVSIVQFLLENVGKGKILQYINARDFEGRTAMCHAVVHGHIAIVQLLVRAGGDVWLTDRLGRTCLHAAAVHGHASIIQFLLQNVDKEKLLKYVNIRSKDGFTALFCGSIDGYIAVVELLYNAGGNIFYCEKGGRTCLHAASTNGYTNIVQFLLQNIDTNLICQYVNARNDDGITAVFDAMVNGHVSVLQQLVRAGGDIWCPYKEGSTCLHVAATNGNMVMVRLLLQSIDNKDNLLQYINFRDTEGFTAISHATLNGHVAVVQLLVRMGGDIWSQDTQGRTCLHLASNRGHVPTIQVLLQSFGDNDKLLQYVNVRDLREITAISHAACNGHVAVVQLLVRVGGDIWLRNKEGSTCLHLAANKGQVPSIQALLQSFDNTDKLLQYVNVRNSNEIAAVSLAIAAGHNAVVELLVRVGGDLWATDIQGYTCLHHAVYFKHVSIAKYLLKNVSNNKDTVIQFMNVCNSEGFSAMALAKLNNHTSMIQLLRSVLES